MAIFRKIFINGWFLFALFGCAGTTYDFGTSFHIRGIWRGIKEVEIYFIDVGYDDMRSKEKAAIMIGKSRSNGQIDVQFNYLWSSKNKSPRNSRKFEIQLVQNGIIVKKYEFTETKLKIEKNGSYLVELGIIEK